MEEKDTEGITHPLNTMSGSSSTIKHEADIKTGETALTLGEESVVENTVTFDPAIERDEMTNTSNVSSFVSSTMKQMPEEKFIDTVASSEITNPHFNATFHT